MKFDWDEGNERHIALHGLSRVDVEEALADLFGLLVDTVFVDDEERFLHVGATVRGRILAVAFTMREDAIRPVTAFDADSYIARIYREGEKR